MTDSNHGAGRGPEPAGGKPLPDSLRERIRERVRNARRGGDGGDSGGRRGTVVPRHGNHGDVPLSPAQERLWLVERVRPGTPLFNITRTLHMEGGLHEGALAAALGRLLARHDALRTGFFERGEEARQRVLPPAPGPLHPAVVDLSALPAERRNGEAQRRADAQAHRPFDLGSPPLVRAVLLRLAEDRHRLLLTFHHLIFDGTSLGVLLRDLGELYGAAVEKRPPRLPDLPFAHADYAAWAHGIAQGEAGQDDLEHWLASLRGAPAGLDLPTDRPRPSHPGFRGGTAPLEVPAETVRRLQDLAARHGVSPFAVLLAAWAALLSRLSGQPGVVVGVPAADRPQPGGDDAVGLFVQTLPLPMEVGRQTTPGDLVRQAAKNLVHAMSRPRLPVGRLLDALAAERGGGRTPLFQTLLSMDPPAPPLTTLPPPPGRHRGIELELETVRKGASERDLSLIVSPRGEGWEGTLLYDRDLFLPATVRRMGDGLLRLLEGMAAEPEVPVVRLPLLSAEERHRVLVEWNRTPDLHPRESTVPALVAETVRDRPDATAVVSGGREHTYAELDATSGTLARRLRELGVGPEVRVGLALERSWEAVVAMLAVLRAGGAYVPLDLDYPSQRLDFILEDSRASLVLVAGQRGRELDPGERPVLDLEELLSGTPPEATAAAAPDGPPSAAATAYVMYTSGSTGRPKGVAVPHRGIVRLVRGGGFADLGPGQTFLQLAPLAFDAATLELWGPLANGGRLVVAPPGPLSLAALGRAVAEGGVTTLWLTAGLFHQVVDEAMGALSGVEQLLAGGDVLSVPHVRRVLEELPHCRLVNGYGPTENTTFTCCCDVRSAGIGTSVPIGTPLSGTRVYLLDGELEPVPVGVPGELWTAGDGLARGYLDRPGLTADRFRPHPFAEGEGGERLYRTGDLARWRPDGQIEFLGRRDGQVKLRGFRVELGETVAALNALPETREAVVVVRGEGEAAQLVAYVVPEVEDGAAPGPDLPERLLAALREELPAFMVPRHVVFLDRMPLGPTGKVDRRALPEPGTTSATAAPRTPLEAELAELWGELLRIDPPGIDEDFFVLGGHSLLATRLLGQVARRWGADLPMAEVFDFPTVAGLAARIEARIGTAGEASGGGAATGPAGPTADPPIVRRDRTAPLPPSSAQRRLWLLDRLHPGRSTYVIPVALRLRGPLAEERLARALTSLSARHEALRTRLVTRDEALHALVEPPFPVVPPRVDLSGLPVQQREDELARCLAAEAKRPFSLDWRLVRTLLLGLERDHHVLTLTFHHAIADAGSLAVLAEELEHLYGSPDTVPPPPELQAADVAAWEEQRLASPAGEADLAWWRRHLEGVPPLLNLPVDHPRQAASTDRGGRAAAELPLEILRGTSRLATARGLSPFAVGLASFLALLARLTGLRDLAVAVPRSARVRPELERVVGFLVETLPVRVQLGDDPTFGRFAERVHRELLEVREHDRVPFERLVDEVLERRPAGALPLVQAIFDRREVTEVRWSLAGLEVEPLEVKDASSKFDVGLEVMAGREGGRAVLSYRRDLFTATTAESILEAWTGFLTIALTAPETRLSALPLGPALERRVDEHLRSGPRPALPATVPAPAGTESLRRQRYEEAVAEIWREVLDVDDVPADADFFALGGNSLVAVRVIARVHRRLGVELPLLDLFDAPTVAGLAERIAAARGTGGADPGAAAAVGAGLRRAPLSFAQQRLWFLERLEPGRNLYAIPTRLTLEGPVAVGALEAALVEIVRRHEVLRTRFELPGDEPVQVVQPESRARHFALGTEQGRLPVVDLGALPAEAAAAEGIRVEATWAARLFDIDAGPLLHALLLSMAPDLHRLVLSVHHVVFDGWSSDRFHDELATLYGSFAAGRPSPLPPLPAQYVDHAVWQRRRLASGALDGEAEYWRRTLADVALLELPTDRPRLAVRGLRGGYLEDRFSETLVASLLHFARERAVTPFLVLMTAFQALLSRLAGQSDVCVGMPVAGRERLEDEGLIGYFSNTLALRCDLSDDPSFATLLTRVRNKTLEALSHSRLPFDRVVQEVQPERSTSHAPLFQAMLAYREVERRHSVASRVEGIPRGVTPFDLSLGFARRGEDISYYAEWDRDLFDRATLLRWCRSLDRLLAAALARPEQPVGDLPMVSTSERHQLLYEWSGASHHHLAPEPLPVAGIARWAERRPQAPALICGDEELTFAETWRRVGHLADTLVEAGVGPEVRVAVALDLSSDWATSMLGILAAGGTYVPLDVSAPTRRQQMILEDSGASLVLTRPGSDGNLPQEGPPRIDVRKLFRKTGDQPHAGPPGEPPSLPEQALAYTIFTSGSTGRPKGVETSYRALADHLGAISRYYGFRSEDRVLQFSSPAFDVSLSQLLAPLLAGATVVLRDSSHWGLDDLAGAIDRHRVTMTDLPPALWREWVEALEIEGGMSRSGRSLRIMALGGEAVPPAHVPRWYALPAGHGRLINAYGPTEATITSTTHAVPRSFDPARSRGVPIGRPLQGMTAHVLDSRGRKVPAGVMGELVLGGDLLARGYRNRPRRTAERFVPCPFSARPGSRLYRTGDRVRLRSDGLLDFLGRFDDQIQVRGFRVELGEVEAALGDLDGVVEWAAGVREVDGKQRLVAWVVPEPGAPAAARDPVALRSRLGQALPHYMVPSDVVVTEALPRLTSGKLDRRSLPLPAPLPTTAEAVPEGDLEQRVGEIWRRILGIERVGRHDNFFDLGGHSLLLIRMHREIAPLSRDEVALVELFSHPTVASLARRLRGGPERGEDEAPPRRAPAVLASRQDRGAVAVVGLACRLPGAPDPESLWDKLRNGVESVHRFSEEELLAAGIPEERVRDADYVPAAGALGDVDRFDAPFFRMTPREAELMDPQQRLFLEVAWQALEDAGVVPGTPGNRVGVYAGAGISRYLMRNLLSRPDLLASAGMMQVLIGNDKDNLPTQVAYRLDLRGPAVAVQTACSTSLVATHLASRGLLTGDCDAALVGGATVAVPQVSGYLFEEGGILSPDGHCRTFDVGAGGTVPGSGAAAVVLMRLEDALAQGHTIRAVLRGSAINNDGALKVGYTAPGVEGQAEVIRAALEDAGVEASSLSYVEAHGTATALGDSIEVAALGTALGEREPGSPLWLGSVKSNLGHLDTAAGVAGLIKTVLALQHREIPPSLHFRRPNPELRLKERSFRVVDRLLPWGGPGPRRAGVSSFGIGGTNAHVVLEEAPPEENVGEERPWHLLALSTRSEATLERAVRRLGDHLQRHPELPLDDVAHTLRVGRRAFLHRTYVVCRDQEEAAAALAPDAPPLPRGEASEEPPPVVFLFPGQGVQHPGAGAALYRREAAFREAVDLGADRLAPRLGFDPRRVLFPGPGERKEAARRLEETAVTQPLLFLLEYGIARLWRSRGLRPAALLGHSLGELAAAALAGVFSFEDACDVVAERGRLMQSMPPGAMAAVLLSEDDLSARLPEDLALAAVNAPRSCVVSGSRQAVERFYRELAADGIESRTLAVRHAFHSPLMDGCLEAFHRVLEGVELGPPSLPVISNRTGRELAAEAATDPAYWVEQLRRTVRFGDGAATVLADPRRVFLEVGPGRVLGGLLRRQPEARVRLVVPALPDPPKDRESVPDAPSGARADAEIRSDLEAAGRLWTAGVELRWTAFSAGRRRRVSLPTYPFEEHRYWIDAAPAQPPPPRSATGKAAYSERVPSAAEAAATLPAGEAPRRGHTRPPLPTPWVAPGEGLEETVAATWEELLGIEGIGADDDFFELGGDSLLATRVVARLRGELNVEVAVAHLFDNPTVAGLAAACRDRGAAPGGGKDAVAAALQEIAALSPEEVEAMLAAEEESEGALSAPAEREIGDE